MTNLYLDYQHIAKRILQYLKRTITFRLKYSYNIKYYKTSYTKPNRMSYIVSNYASDIKSKQFITSYNYYLNEIEIFLSSKNVKIIIVS